MQTHLIFDLGGTLIFDPFDSVIEQFYREPLREKLAAAIDINEIETFLSEWRSQNAIYNFPFASHFLQEETWIARAMWPIYMRGKVLNVGTFPSWTIEVLQLYRSAALHSIRSQQHLGELRNALCAAKERGYRLSVASNDRYYATSAMLAAAGILDFFDFIGTSEGLSFDSDGAEKPSPAFFKAFERYTDLDFSRYNTLYVGDDETRDISSAKSLPLRTVRFFGNKSRSKSWLDNRDSTQADFSFENYSQLCELIHSGILER